MPRSGETNVDAMIYEAWIRTYKLIHPYVVQLCEDGRRIHHKLTCSDAEHWFTEMFGYHTRPLKGVWYTIPRTLLVGSYTEEDEYVIGTIATTL